MIVECTPQLPQNGSPNWASCSLGAQGAGITGLLDSCPSPGMLPRPECLSGQYLPGQLVAEEGTAPSRLVSVAQLRRYLPGQLVAEEGQQFAPPVAVVEG